MRKLFYLVVGIGLITLNGCTLSKMVKMAKDQQLTVDPNPLELHGNTVDFEISGILPVKMLKPNYTYSVEVQYEYADKAAKFEESMDFNGDNFPAGQQPRVSKKFSMPYSGEEMNVGSLTIQGYAKANKTSKTAGPTPKLEVAKGLITTSRLVKATPHAAYVSYDYKDETVGGWTPNEELEPTEVNFYFQQGRSQLRASETASERGKFLSAFIAEKNVTRTVTIIGTHSPEGSETKNTSLSADRAKVIEDFYRKEMNRYDYKGVADSINFILKPVVRDWTEFKAMLEKYDGIDMAAKNEMLSIVNGSGTFEDKEKRMQKIAGYKKVFNDLYPELRRARTEILTVIPKRSAAEISVLAKQIVEGKIPTETLSYGELAYAAYLTPSLKEKADIYEAAAKTYNNWACRNNLGAVYLQMAAAGEGNVASNVEKALTQLEMSAKMKNNAYAKGNQGVAEMLLGNADKAHGILTEAVAMNMPSKDLMGFNGAKGALEIMKGSYGEAVKSLSNASATPDVMFNKGLAQLLAKDYQNAMVSFNELTGKNSNYGMGYYGAALAAARLGRGADVASNVSKAVAADPALKSKAAADLEFAKFAGSSDFINAVR
jgi:tetratricopeptide (TPR) repeat protein/outer membrane protein OmpA-like peptidoglycan-associated protein